MKFVSTQKAKTLSYFQISWIRRDNEAFRLPFTYTAMHGVGHRFAVEVFRRMGLQPFVTVENQCTPDPAFPTVAFPNPEEGKGALQSAIETAERHKSLWIFANDPDADRLAVAERASIDSPWTLLTGNQMGSILGAFLVEEFLFRNPDVNRSLIYVIASTVSSKFLKTLARHHGISFTETLTGFKWIGNKAVDLEREGKKVLFGYEEAIGFMVGDTVRDKDGISALGILAELIVQLKKRGSSLTQYLAELSEKLGWYVTDNSYFLCRDGSKMTAIFDRMRYGVKILKDQVLSQMNTCLLSPTLRKESTLNIL